MRRGAVRRPVVFELAVALSFALAAVRVGVDPERLAETLLFAVPLLILLLIDVWTRFVHTDVIGVAFGLPLVLAALDGVGAFAEAVVGAVSAAGIFARFSAVIGLLPRAPRTATPRPRSGRWSGFRGCSRRSASGSSLPPSPRSSSGSAAPGGGRVAIGYGPWLCLGALVTLAR